MTTRPHDALRSREAEFVLPKPPRSPGHLLVTGAGDRGRARWIDEGLRSLGDRLQTLVGCQDLFLAELRATVRAGDPDLEKMARILDWFEAVQTDLHLEGIRAAAGRQAIDLVELCRDVVDELTRDRPGLVVQMVAAGPCPIWNPVLACGRLLQVAIELVAERTGGQGGLAIECSNDAGGPAVRVRGFADPAGGIPEALVRAFRQALAEAAATADPDDLGPGGTGMVLRFPG